MNKPDKILQIVPADGWFALYGGKTVTRRRIAVWALIEDESGERGVIGMSGPDYLMSCEIVEDFIGYHHCQDQFDDDDDFQTSTT